jgi:hypothetical protein
MKVKVTAKHIEAGRVCQADCCPIALALKELGHKYVQVTKPYIDFDIKRIVTPPEVRLFMKRFDAHLPVEPMEFEL